MSELLRERLGPTSEYVTSLISIQAAYINTNHPAFVQGTQDYARKRQQEQVAQREAAAAATKHRKRTNQAAGRASDPIPSRLLDGDVDTTLEHSEGEADDGPYTVPNGRGNPPPGMLEPPKPRTASHSGQRPHSPQPGLGHHAHQPSLSGPNSAKESFLNYFFGANQAIGANGSSLAGPSQRNSLPELGAPRAGNPLAGRRGLEGSAAAFDMKSLDKHLEAGPSAAESSLIGGNEREDVMYDIIRKT